MTPTHSIPVKPWDDILTFYRNIGWGGPMAEFVGLLKSSDFAASLFATTSMGDLCVSRYNPLPWQKEMLTVSFDPKTQLAPSCVTELELPPVSAPMPISTPVPPPSLISAGASAPTNALAVATPGNVFPSLATEPNVVTFP